MKKQQTFTDMEYSCRKKKTRREEFLEIMDELIPWDEWVGIIAPYYPGGKRGRPPMGIERMLRMTVAAKLIREDDEVVYGDSGYLGLQKRPEVRDNPHLSGIDYRINRHPHGLPKVSDNSID